MYLVDTNIWLERLLEQERTEEVKNFLDKVPSESFWITDFALHSISLSLIRLKKTDLLLRFVKDMFIEGSVVLVHLAPEDTEVMLQRMMQFHLDFDDAYQYIAAEKYNLIIVSFDPDFDRAERGRKTPGQALAEGEASGE